jgi:uncharacterized protein (DUF2147 family)
MKQIILAFGLVVTAAVAQARDPVEWLWQTKADDYGHFGHVQIKPGGPAFCGTLVSAFDGAGAKIASPNVGKRNVWDMVAYGDGPYDDGKVWSPDRDKTYNADMTLTGGRLAVRGCVLGICRDGATWCRVQ